MLTPAQLQTLKAAIFAETDPAFVAARTAGSTAGMAEWFNVDAPGPVKAWRTEVWRGDLFEAMSLTSFDSLTTGKRDAWRLLMDQSSSDGINFARNKMRAAVVDVWPAAQATNILTAMLENASRAEVLFGGNNATDATVTGLRRNWAGDLTNNDIELALVA